MMAPAMARRTRMIVHDTTLSTQSGVPPIVWGKVASAFAKTVSKSSRLISTPSRPHCSSKAVVPGAARSMGESIQRPYSPGTGNVDRGPIFREADLPRDVTVGVDLQKRRADRILRALRNLADPEEVRLRAFRRLRIVRDEHCRDSRRDGPERQPRRVERPSVGSRGLTPRPLTASVSRCEVPWVRMTWAWWRSRSTAAVARPFGKIVSNLWLTGRPWTAPISRGNHG